jgi:HAD superfamily hydrolase (TIGR01509 family)
MNKIKAILFDMDGVLIDAKDWHYEALNRALSFFGLEISRHEHLVTFDGLPTKKKLEMLSKEGKLPLGLHAIISVLKQKYTMQIIAEKCNPKFEHQYALSRLELDGYRMAVCSNSIRQSIDVMLKKAAISHHFDFYLSNEDVRQSKPNSEIYDKAINRMGLKAEECLILEDNENGIKAACDSGAHVMVIADVNDVNYALIKEKIRKIEEL